MDHSVHIGVHTHTHTHIIIHNIYIWARLERKYTFVSALVRYSELLLFI